jgi:hypothetical protein
VQGDPTKFGDPTGQYLVCFDNTVTSDDGVAHFVKTCVDISDPLPSPTLPPSDMTVCFQPKETRPPGCPDMYPGEGNPPFDPQVGLDNETDLLRKIVNRGDLGDCQALNVFAQVSWATNSQSVGMFVASFGRFIPETSLHGLSIAARPMGISFTSSPEAQVLLNNGTHPGTFGARYNDAGFPRESVDQTHHFSFYLQLGYLVGGVEADILAIIQDAVKGNQADYNLGVAAANLGNALRHGGSVEDFFSGLHSLCQ